MQKILKNQLHVKKAVNITTSWRKIPQDGLTSQKNPSVYQSARCKVFLGIEMVFFLRCRTIK